MTSHLSITPAIFWYNNYIPGVIILHTTAGGEQPDYQSQSGVPLTFQPGDTELEVRVAIEDDDLVEAVETFSGHLTPLREDIVEVIQDTAIVRITDNEGRWRGCYVWVRVCGCMCVNSCFWLLCACDRVSTTSEVHIILYMTIDMQSHPILQLYLA